MLSICLSMATCVVLILLLRRLAHHIGAVDIPGGRKQHEHPTPTVGGLGMYFAVMLTLLWNGVLINNIAVLMGCITILVILGVLDDKHGLSVRLRLMLQVFLVSIVITDASGMITHLGELFGSASAIPLGTLAIPISVIAYVGGINAMNMIDGADGMAGKMALISTIGVAFIAYTSNDTELIPLTLAMIGALIAFLLFNTRIFIRRAWIFMGDAGSMWLGLALSWLLAQLTNGIPEAEPALTLWLFGIPLIDTLIVMTRRIRYRKSPFSADRTHIHHILEHAGFSVRRTVLMLSLVQVTLVGIGITFYLTQAPAWIVFWSFVLLMAIYYYRIRFILLSTAV